MSWRFCGIDHLGVVVADLDAAERAYADLGLPIGGSEELPDRGLAVRFADIGDSRIELISPAREDSEISPFLRKRAEGIHHICLRVTDIDAALADMKARGVKLINETSQPGAEGKRVAFVHPRATCGVLIELVEIPTEEQHE